MHALPKTGKIIVAIADDIFEKNWNRTGVKIDTEVGMLFLGLSQKKIWILQKKKLKELYFQMTGFGKLTSLYTWSFVFLCYNFEQIQCNS